MEAIIGRKFYSDVELEYYFEQLQEKQKRRTIYDLENL